MKAFENCERTKDELLASLARHREADNLILGHYWVNGKGCAIGCSIHDFRPGAENRHSEYEPLFGIPKALAYLEDTIFERLPEAAAPEWPERFVNAIQPGADLTQVFDRFTLWLLSGEDSPLADWRDVPCMSDVAGLYRRRLDDDEPEAEEWVAARTALEAAKYSIPADLEYLAAADYRDATWASLWASERMADKLISLLKEAEK